MLGTTVALVLGAGAYWIWSNNMHFRERAIRASGAACRDLGLQLLDQTVVLRRWRLRKGADGRVQAHRVYLFEYSGDGLNRCVGRVVFFGGRLQYICFEQSGQPMILHCDKALENDGRQ